MGSRHYAQFKFGSMNYQNAFEAFNIFSTRCSSLTALSKHLVGLHKYDAYGDFAVGPVSHRLRQIWMKKGISVWLWWSGRKALRCPLKPIRKNRYLCESRPRGVWWDMQDKNRPCARYSVKMVVIFVPSVTTMTCTCSVKGDHGHEVAFDGLGGSHRGSVSPNHGRGPQVSSLHFNGDAFKTSNRSTRKVPELLAQEACGFQGISIYGAKASTGRNTITGSLDCPHEKPELPCLLSTFCAFCSY